MLFEKEILCLIQVAAITLIIFVVIAEKRVVNSVTGGLLCPMVSRTIFAMIVLSRDAITTILIMPLNHYRKVIIAIQGIRYKGEGRNIPLLIPK